MIASVIAVILALGGVIAIIIAAASQKSDTRADSLTVAIVVFALAGIIFIFNVFTIIDPGYGAVTVLAGNTSDEPLDQGFHWVNPFCDVEEYEIRTQDYTMTSVIGEGQEAEKDDAIHALSKDGLDLKMDATFYYRPTLHALPWIHRNFGPNYRDVIIRPPSRTALREATKEFVGQEAFALKRDLLANRISEVQRMKVDSILATYADAPKDVFVFAPVQLRQITLPDKVKEAIETKIQAEQEAERMDFVLKKEEKEAKRKQIEAEGIKNFQDIVSKGITPDLLKWKGIEATERLAESPNSKVVVIGGPDGLPLILGQ